MGVPFAIPSKAHIKIENILSEKDATAQKKRKDDEAASSHPAEIA